MTKEKQITYQQARRNGFAASGACAYCGVGHPQEGYRTCDSCRRNAANILRELKKQVIAGYGGCCACCGESTYEFLCVDHVNNDGAVERRANKKYNGGLSILRLILRENFPRRYQILCYNCNMAKGFFGGCPHMTSIENRTGTAHGPLFGDCANPNHRMLDGSQIPRPLSNALEGLNPQVTCEQSFIEKKLDKANQGL